MKSKQCKSCHYYADESSKGGMGGTQEGGTPAMIRGSINHPAHYQLDNGMEAIDIIRGVLGDKGYKDFCRGNTLKYLCRAGKKGLITDDLKKAAWYLDAEIEAYEEADDEWRQN